MSEDITDYLNRYKSMDSVLVERAWRSILPRLARISHNLLYDFVKGEGQGASLFTTDLVHLAYPRLSEKLESPYKAWGNRSQFFAFARRALLWTLVDYQRFASRHSPRIDAALPVSEEEFGPSLNVLIDLEKSLARLATIDPESHDIIRLRFLEDHSVSQVVAISGLSKYKVLNRSRLGLAFLCRCLSAP